MKQHVDDLPRRAIAEELAERLLMPGNPVPIDQVDELGRCEAAQCGLGEVRVGREEVIGRGTGVREIAAAPA